MDVESEKEALAEGNEGDTDTIQELKVEDDNDYQDDKSFAKQEEVGALMVKIHRVGILFLVAGFVLLLIVNKPIGLLFIGIGIAIIRTVKVFCNPGMFGKKTQETEVKMEQQHYQALNGLATNVGRGSLVVGILSVTPGLVFPEPAITNIEAVFLLGVWINLTGLKTIWTTIKAILKLFTLGHVPRLRSAMEIKTKASTFRGFQIFLAMSFLLGGSVIISGEIWILAEIGPGQVRSLGITTQSWLSMTFLLAGFTLLVISVKPSRVSAVVALLTTIVSFAAAVFILCNYYQTIRKFPINVAKQLLAENKFASIIWKDPTGKMYFPFLPWTPIALMVTAAQVFMVSVSFVGVLTSFNLLVSFQEPSDICEAKKQRSVSRRIVFVTVGSMLLMAGLATCLVKDFISILDSKTYGFPFYGMHVLMIAIPYVIIGLLCFKTEPKGSTPTRLLIFLLAGMIFLSGPNRIDKYYWDSMSGKFGDFFDQGNVCQEIQNRSDFCVKLVDSRPCEAYKYTGRYSSCLKPAEIVCIPDKKRMDGVLDLFDGPPNSTLDRTTNTIRFTFNGKEQEMDLKTYRKQISLQRCQPCAGHSWPHMADEQPCYREFGLYLDIVHVSFAGLGPLAALVLWFLTYDSLVVAGRYFINHIKTSWKKICEISN